jgi:integrase
MPRKAAAVHIVGPVRLIQRGRYWHASYTSETGRVRQSLKVTNLKVAQQKAREIAELIERGEYATLQDRRELKNQNFAGFITEFREKHRSWSDSTWDGVNGIIARYEEEWGQLPLTAINTRIIESFITRRLDQDGVTKATANRNLACLKTIFKMAVRWGYVIHNPAEKIKAFKETPTIPRALSESEVELFLNELPDHARVFAVVAVDTGMRRSELLRLQWQDVDFDRKQITVRQSKNNTFRVIPMTNRVHKTLVEQRQKGIIPYVLAGRTGEEIKSVKDAIAGAGDRAKIGHVHLHMLRHTFATRLRERSVALDRIMELLGHKTMVMTLRYAKVTPTQLRDAIEALNSPNDSRQQEQG